MATSLRAGTARRMALGGTLLAGSWYVAWHASDFGRAGHFTFFPLWLGYVLALDAVTEWRAGTSLFRRSRIRWLAMFAASVPAWWLFEGFNRYLGNWQYIGVTWSPLLRFAHSSLCFSTVVPTVFTTAEAIHHLPGASRRCRGPRLPWSPTIAGVAVLFGLALGAGVVARPALFFPTVWLCVFLVLDPIDHRQGWPSLLDGPRRGVWRPVLVVVAAALVCGLLWELWNYHSTPKWIYHVSLAPFGLAHTIGDRRLFEMPLLGYGGYVPFGLEVYALYQFCVGVFGRSTRCYLLFDAFEAAPTGRATVADVDAAVPPLSVGDPTPCISAAPGRPSDPML